MIMKPLSAIVKALTCTLFVVSLSSAAHAVTRTWVSGVGDDINPCSRTAPCKTFAGAISKTDPNGEIDALDSGGFGAVTITKSITIDGGGYIASILGSGTNGVNVNDSATATPNTILVTLRRLTINGANTGVNGINFTSGKTLNVESCQIFGFTGAAPNGAGIRVSLTVSGSNLNVSNTSIFRNRVGISGTTATGNVTLNVTGCNIKNNTTDGVFLDARAFATVRDSNFAFNGGAAVSLNNSANNSATVDDSELNHNQLGLFIGTGTTVRLGRSTVIQNTTNFTNNGTLVTFCNNETDTAVLPGTIQSPCLK
jgi:hypothetical protein